MVGTEAKATRTGTCRRCGASVETGSRGRIAALCKPCKRERNAERSRKPKPQKCDFCQCVFVAACRRKFCDACHKCFFFNARKAICLNCNGEFAVASQGGNVSGKYCRRSCWVEHKRRLHAEKEILRSLKRRREAERKAQGKAERKRWLSECKQLGAWAWEWNAPLRQARSRKRTRPKWSRKHTSRARKRGLPRTYGEVMSIERIGQRDAWVCQLCMEPIEDTATRKGPGAPCVDHIVPIGHTMNTKHGHTPENVQIAHRRCNEAKGSTLACESLLDCDDPRRHVESLGIDQTPPTRVASVGTFPRHGQPRVPCNIISDRL